MSGATAEAAQQLRALHHRGTAFVLPNAWDATSARAIAQAGFPAVGTTSAGIADALGFADGETVSADAMLAAVARIAAAVDVPVTADLEAGYGLDGRQLLERLLAAGAVGLNLEDTDHASGRLRAADEQAERIAAVRAAAREADVPIVINARVDVALRRPNTADQVADVVARGRTYIHAGADCVFPILLTGEAAIATVVEELDAPVNAMLHPRVPPIERLRALAVARISLGAGLHRTASADLTERLDALRAADLRRSA